MPVTDYAYYRAYIERLKQGEITAMFGPQTKVLMLALTSGTTDKCKFVPITQEFFDEYRHGWNLWGVGTYRDHLDLVRKKTLKLGSNWRQFYTEGGHPLRQHQRVGRRDRALDRARPIRACPATCTRSTIRS